MNRTTVLGRKLIYLTVLVAMLVPLYLLGQPAGGGSDVGGRLTVMRHEFNIAESDLGEISPASETMKLASLGLRGVAASLLWRKTHNYRVTHEWDRLKAAVNNIALLQPHSEKVWEFHSHNLTYNVSTEFDDYRQRYEMVREGTEFLQKGVRQNRNATRLVWYTGWFYGSKMGMSDEKVQFRRLFADDEVLHKRLIDEDIPVDSLEALGPLGKPDNWLVGRLWLNKGYALVDDAGVKIRRQTPLNFFETGPKWQMKHAESIEKEGILDVRAQDRWERASDVWRKFGERSIPTTAAFTIKLGELDELIRQRAQKVEEFKELTGETWVKAREQKIKELPPDLKTVWDRPIDERDENDERLMEAIELRIQPDLAKVAKESDPSVRLRAINLVGELADLEERTKKTDGYRTQINYPYWKTLAQAEQEARTVKARKLIHDAEEANSMARIDEAIELYDQAFAIWAEIFDDYPILTIDDTADDLFDSIRNYMVAIDSQEFPDDFPLQSFVVMMSNAGRSDSPTYLQIREQMEEAAEARKKELEEEEKRREQEAASAEQSGDATTEEKSAEEMKEDTESAKPAEEKAAEEKPAEVTSAEEEKPANEEKPAGDEKADQEKEADAEKSDTEKAGEEKSGEEKSGEEAEEKADESPQAEPEEQDPSGDDQPSGTDEGDPKPDAPENGEETPADETPAEEPTDEDESDAGEGESDASEEVPSQAG